MAENHKFIKRESTAKNKFSATSLNDFPLWSIIRAVDSR